MSAYRSIFSLFKSPQTLVCLTSAIVILLKGRKRLDGRIIVSVGMLLMATAATYIKPTIAVGVLLALATFVANLTMSSKEP